MTDRTVTSAARRAPQAGQALPLFTVALSVIVLGTAIVIDGGFAFAERRAAQNAADFAAMAGTRVVGEWLTGEPVGAGTAANVEAAVTTTLAANQAQLVEARYIDEDGAVVGTVVGAGYIPAHAVGVIVEARTEWQPFLLDTIGIGEWLATASATAVTSGSSAAGVMPLGIQDSVFDGLTSCPLETLDECIDGGLASGSLDIPGGFGWLSFGVDGPGGRCPWSSSLGMKADGGCQSSNTYLASQIGPPADSHGCCTAVGETGSEDKIGSLTGNTWADLSYYVDNRIPMWVPIWDSAGGSGAGAYYHIVGFAAIVITGDDEHAKTLEGVAVEFSCEEAGSGFCAAPGDSFVTDATGEVRLVR